MIGGEPLTPGRRCALLCAVLVAAACGDGGNGANEPVRVRVVDVAPTGRVESTAPIRVVFDQPVVEPDDVGAEINRELFVISPQIAGEYRFSAVDQLEFRPDEPFQSATRYRVSVRPEVVGPGRTLMGERAFRFHTPLFALVGTSWSERRGQAQVSLRFSHPVDPVDTAEAALFETEDGLYVAAERITRRPGRRVVLRLPFSLEEARRRGVRMTVDGALQALTGGEPLSKTVVRAVPPPDEETELRIMQITADQKGVAPAIEIETSEPVDPRALADHLQIEPDVRSKTVVDTGAGALVLGDLQTGSSYRVRIEPGLVGRDGGELFDPAEAEVQLPVMKPGVAFADEHRFLELPADGAIGLRTRGVHRAQLVVQPVAEVNAVHLLDVLERGAPLPSPTLVGAPQTVEWTVDDPAGVVSETRHVPPVPGAHILKVSLRDADRPWVRADRWVLGRGLRMVIKRTDDRLWAFVVDTDRGGPAEGARVRVRSETNHVLGEQRTDAQGLAEIPLADGAPALVSVHHEERFAFLSIRGSRLVVPASSAAAADAGLLTDRVEVAPGAPVRGLAFVPSGLGRPDLRWRFVEPDGSNAGARPVEVDASGWAEATATAPRQLTPSTLYAAVDTLEGVRVGAARLVLEPAFHRGIDLQVASMATPPGKSEAPAFTVAAPDAARVQARCRYLPRTLLGPGGSRARGAFDPFEGPRQPVTEDEVRCPIPDGVRGPAWVELQVEATDDRGRQARRSVRAPFSRETEVVAFEVSEDEAPEVSVAILGPGGQAMAGRSMTYTWSRLVSTTALVWDESAGLVREGARREVPVSEGRSSSAAEPVALPFEPPEPGRYRLVVDTGGVRGERVVTVGAEDPLLQLAVTPERPSVGDTVRVRVRADRPGWSLVSLEQDRVLAHRWVEVRDGRADVELAVPPEAGPRAHVVVAHAGRAALTEVAIDAGPAPPEVSVRPFGSSGGKLRYLVRVEPRPAGTTSVVLAPGRGAGLRAAHRVWQRQGGLRVATHGLSPESVLRVPQVRTSTAAAVEPRWHRAEVRADGWGVFEVDRPLTAGAVTYLLRTGDRLRAGSTAVEAHLDPWMELRGPERLRVGDEAPLAWRASRDLAPSWVGAEAGQLRPASPGLLTVTAQAAGARAGWSTSVHPAAARFLARTAWVGYERPGSVDLPDGGRAWAWVGPQPVWQGAGTLLALSTRPSDAATRAARLLLALTLGDVMTGVVRAAADRGPASIEADLSALVERLRAEPLGLDAWTALAASVALESASAAGYEAPAESRRRALRAARAGPPAAATAARALSSEEVELDAAGADALARLIIAAARAPVPPALMEPARSEPEVHPAREALRLWALQRAHFAQSSGRYWGSVARDGAIVRRFNDQRAATVELTPPGRVTFETTGAGQAYAGLAVALEFASASAASVRVAVEPLDGRATLRLGEAAWIRAEVNRDEPWLAEVRLPSGVALEARSGWTEDPGSAPPDVPPSRLRYDPERHALVAASPDGGPATVRAVVRGAWPGTFGGPIVSVAHPDRSEPVDVIQGPTLRIEGDPE